MRLESNLYTPFPYNPNYTMALTPNKLDMGFLGFGHIQWKTLAVERDAKYIVS